MTPNKDINFHPKRDAAIEETHYKDKDYQEDKISLESFLFIMFFLVVAITLGLLILENGISLSP